MGVRLPPRLAAKAERLLGHRASPGPWPVGLGNTERSGKGTSLDVPARRVTCLARRGTGRVHCDFTYGSNRAVKPGALVILNSGVETVAHQDRHDGCDRSDDRDPSQRVGGRQSIDVELWKPEQENAERPAHDRSCQFLTYGFDSANLDLIGHGKVLTADGPDSKRICSW